MEKNIITSDGNIRKGHDSNDAMSTNALKLGNYIATQYPHPLFVLLWVRTVVGHLIYPFLLNHERKIMVSNLG